MSTKTAKQEHRNRRQEHQNRKQENYLTANSPLICASLLFCIALVPFCCVVHSFWGHLAAFSVEPGSFCHVLQNCFVLRRFSACSLRYASIWRQFAPSCIDSAAIRCVLHGLCGNTLRPALTLRQFAASCIDSAALCCVLH